MNQIKRQFDKLERYSSSKKDSLDAKVRDQIRDFAAMLHDNYSSLKSIADTMYDEAGMMAGEEAQALIKAFGRFLLNQ